MKTALLYALPLAALVLAAAPLAAQDQGGGQSAPQAGAPDSAPAGAPPQAPSASKGGPSAFAGLAAAAPPEARKDAAAADDKLYFDLKRGGEVMFQKDKARAGKRPRYKGYTKKGLEKYKRAAEEKRLDADAVKELPEEKAKEARKLAAEAEMSDDVKDTIAEKSQAAEAAGAAPEEKEKLAAAADAAKSVSKSIGRKMKRLEADAGGKKIFREPSAEKNDATPGDEATEPGQPKR